MDRHGCGHSRVHSRFGRQCGTTAAATAATAATETIAATAKLQQNYSSYSRATVTPGTSAQRTTVPAT
eukprot:1642798-Prymnesium_polylepis.1